jgi:hypothetical protein
LAKRYVVRDNAVAVPTSRLSYVPPDFAGEVDLFFTLAHIPYD